MSSDDKIIEQAIEWMLLLEQQPLTAQQRSRFEQWQAADPRHATAYANLTQSVQQFDVPRQVGAAPDILRNTLQQKSQRRKRLKQIAVLAGLGAGTAALLDRVTPLESLSADLHTATAERQRTVLADGSILILNARSAIDHLIRPDLRQLRLLAGDVQLQVAARAALPFSIETLHGQVSASAGLITMSLQAQRTDVVTAQAAAMLTTRNGSRAELGRDRHTWFDSNVIAPAHGNDGSEGAWVQGYFTASDTPLAEVVAALRPYRKGLLRLDPAVAQLRISGAFPLDDTDRALTALASALPIAVTRVTPFWVSISARS